MISEDCRTMNYLIHSAKGFLVEARIRRQKASILADDDLYNEANQFGSMTDIHSKLAKEARQDARTILKEIEISNGRAYLAGEKPFPLKYALCGRNFRIWDAYQHLYDADTLFKGVDPE